MLIISKLPVFGRLLPFNSISKCFLSSIATDPVKINFGKFNEESKEFRIRQIEQAFDEAVPKLLQGGYIRVVPFLARDFKFEDKVRGGDYNTMGLALFIMKMRLYLGYKSPHKRFETLGTHVFPEENLVSLIWRLTQTKNMRASYALSPKMLISQVKYLLSSGRARSQAERLERRASKEIITDTEATNEPATATNSNLASEKSAKKDEIAEEPNIEGMSRIEECLDIHINEAGYVERIVNRAVTERDFELANFRKEELERELDKKLRTAMRREEAWKKEKEEKAQDEKSIFGPYK